ncbi:MAG TPA: tRNA (adenosine(37)-N6)-threonylcarbamoyltransferase complex ATPase subunit type 1 TsaE [Candidatus Saccharimonadales bacterium]|nr:tRNA (adenosine(37)-N6)-threonylcarbamoyltransferase complex ATPase subunit type 1 TsaE [Candidatus Saccharimonadales bacterium]
MTTKSSVETQNFAKEFVSNLQKPTVVALSGELGSGKTTFTQGVAASLGLKRRALSPTFVFWRSYKLSDSRFKNLEHFDLYRCESLQDVRSTGLSEVLERADSLVLIEWPEIAKELLPTETVWVRFEKKGENEREITTRVGGPKGNQ